MIKDSFGTPTQGHHTRVVGMLLESAAINVPITIIAVVGIATWSTYGDFMMSVVVPGQVSRVLFLWLSENTNAWYAQQSFASVLVMYQIAHGKAVGGRPDALYDEKVDVV